VERYARAGFRILATAGTRSYLLEHGVEAGSVGKPSESSPNIMDALKAGELSLVINTPTRGRDRTRDGFRIRRGAVEHNCACLTSLDTANALASCLERGVDRVLEPVDIASVFAAKK
jgi:carbamoyl-phosphate synthase large subunit